MQVTVCLGRQDRGGEDLSCRPRRVPCLHQARLGPGRTLDDCVCRPTGQARQGRGGPDAGRLICVCRMARQGRGGPDAGRYLSV